MLVPGHDFRKSELQLLLRPYFPVNLQVEVIFCETVAFDKRTIFFVASLHSYLSIVLFVSKF